MEMAVPVGRWSHCIGCIHWSILVTIVTCYCALVNTRRTNIFKSTASGVGAGRTAIEEPIGIDKTGGCHCIRCRCRTPGRECSLAPYISQFARLDGNVKLPFS